MDTSIKYHFNLANSFDNFNILHIDIPENGTASAMLTVPSKIISVKLVGSRGFASFDKPECDILPIQEAESTNDIYTTLIPDSANERHLESLKSPSQKSALCFLGVDSCPQFGLVLGQIWKKKKKKIFFGRMSQSSRELDA